MRSGDVVIYVSFFVPGKGDSEPGNHPKKLFHDFFTICVPKGEKQGKSESIKKCHFEAKKWHPEQELNLRPTV